MKASKPDFDYLAHSVMFSVSEAEEKKGVRQEDGGDKENDEDSTFSSIAASSTPPRRRGRPPKTKVSDLPEITEYSVSVYIEVEKPPKKTSRGKPDEQAEVAEGGARVGPCTWDYSAIDYFPFRPDQVASCSHPIPSRISCPSRYYNRRIHPVKRNRLRE